MDGIDWKVESRSLAYCRRNLWKDPKRILSAFLGISKNHGKKKERDKEILGL